MRVLLYALAATLAVAGVYLVKNPGSVMINLGRGEQIPGAFVPGCARAVGIVLVIAAAGVAVAAFLRR